MTHITSIEQAEAELNRVYGQGWTEGGQQVNDMATRPHVWEAWRDVGAAQQAVPAAGWQERSKARAKAWEAERLAKRGAR